MLTRSSPIFLALAFSRYVGGISSGSVGRRSVKISFLCARARASCSCVCGTHPVMANKRRFRAGVASSPARWHFVSFRRVIREDFRLSISGARSLMLSSRSAISRSSDASVEGSVDRCSERGMFSRPWEWGNCSCVSDTKY